jgi:DNA-directed RNA polymerase subunit H (RpoH/RPB5)
MNQPPEGDAVPAHGGAAECSGGGGGGSQSPSAAEVARSMATIYEMLHDRRHPDLSSLEDPGNSVEAIVKISESQNVFHFDLPSCSTRVVYNLNPKFKMPDVKKIISLPFATPSGPSATPPGQSGQPAQSPTPSEVVAVILVVRERPVQGKAVDDPSRDVQMFLLKELQFNLTRHELVPEHVPVRDEAEIEAIMRRYRLKSRYMLPLILSTDPVALHLALKHGQVVRITRPSPSAGTFVTYRCCKSL